MRGAGQHEIPEAGETADRLGLAALRRHEARQLRQAAGDERCACRFAETRAFHDAAGNRQHVLQGTAELHADPVRRGIEPEGRTRQGKGECRRQPGLLGGDHHGGRQATRNVGRKAGTGEHGNRMTGQARLQNLRQKP